MELYFAELKGNIVQRVVVADSQEWCETTLGGKWVQTHYSTPGKNYAGIGYTYNPGKDNFISTKHFSKWSLGEDCVWYPPVSRLADSKGYRWNDDGNKWDEVK
jgi:hypothetical protein